ncbi:hypothetical protein PENTCL1PPCAC_22545, partial [Pristionchus entomophagus]
PIMHDDTIQKVPEWKPPEVVMDFIYSIKSDSWDFAILMWEIYSNGGDPYPGLTRLLSQPLTVLPEYRMKMPNDTPGEIAKIALQCWDKNADKRPSLIGILP